MPLILRKIRKAKWYRNENVPWLPEGELQADALSDLYTDSNELSVWHVEGDRSNLERIAVAIMLQADHLANFDYALFDAQILMELDIKVVASPGNTVDEEANSHWHRDLKELSAAKLMGLAQVIHSERAEKKRIPEKSIIYHVADSVSAGYIAPACLTESQKEKMRKYLPGWNRL